MRIGILTLPLHINYGGILQAYALQTVLERMGHDVGLLDKYLLMYDTSIFSFVKNKFRNKLIRCFKKKSNNIRTYHNINISMYTSEFISKYIHYIIGRKFLYRSNPHLDAIIVGSDQIWRKLYFEKSFNKPLTRAYLDFTKRWRIKRVAYAASFGIDYWDYSEKETIDCGTLLHRFDAISVREKSAINLVKKYFCIDVKNVLDPTMLLDAVDYEKLVNIENHISYKRSVMCYILDYSENKRNIIDKISSEKKLIPFLANNPFVENEDYPIKERIQPALEKWITGFIESSLVITDSFHGCVFSIIFKKPFIVFCNKERGNTRIEDLLELFDLKYRLVSTHNEKYIMELSDKDIDWERVYNKLDVLRDYSMQFLKKSLS